MYRVKLWLFISFLVLQQNQVRREIKYALTSLPWISIPTVALFFAEVRGYSKLYDNVDESPLGKSESLSLSLAVKLCPCGDIWLVLMSTSHKGFVLLGEVMVRLIIMPMAGPPKDRNTNLCVCVMFYSQNLTQTDMTYHSWTNTKCKHWQIAVE